MDVIPDEVYDENDETSNEEATNPSGGLPVSPAHDIFQSREKGRGRWRKAARKVLKKKRKSIPTIQRYPRFTREGFLWI
jgi:hypothetical protein